MLCFLHKWFISLAQDSGKPFPKSTHRHLARCEDCRLFVQVCNYLENKAHQAKPYLITGDLNALPKKIQAAMDVPTPKNTSPTHRPAWIPVLVAASLILVISMSVFLLTRPSPDPALTWPQFLETNLAPAALTEAMNKVESPLEQEMNAWKQTMASTADFLRSCLDIQLGGQETD